MCYFCHAQLFEITYAENIKSPLGQHSCRNAKVVEVFCDAGCRLSTRCRPSIHRPPVDALRVPAEMPNALGLDSSRRIPVASRQLVPPHARLLRISTSA